MCHPYNEENIRLNNETGFTQRRLSNTTEHSYPVPNGTDANAGKSPLRVNCINNVFYDGDGKPTKAIRDYSVCNTSDGSCLFLKREEYALRHGQDDEGIRGTLMDIAGDLSRFAFNWVKPKPVE